MQTRHSLYIGDAQKMGAIPDASVQLVVTSPPYPMIEMWDAAFTEMSPGVETLLQEGKGIEAFEAMHLVLDTIWRECQRVLTPGGFACINIGDATRTIKDSFCLYPNHSRIVSAMMRLGMMPLPDILWRKPTNAPNKFMGSGMLPAGAYVTYEHEYILIFRKGGKRIFAKEAKAIRSASAYFWEERNLWFSDVWTDLKGCGQKLGTDGLRERSAAFPFELPYRLINMYSVFGDTVLDPFAGTGTTLMAALASGRNSMGYERVADFKPIVEQNLNIALGVGQARVQERRVAHETFMSNRLNAGKSHKYSSVVYGFPVITRQEVDIRFFQPVSLNPSAMGPMIAAYENI